MTLRVAINGFGRIGRNVLRGWISRGANTDLEIVGMNSTSDPKTSAHLLTYDSILGRLDPSVDIQTTDDTMIINQILRRSQPSQLPLEGLGCGPGDRIHRCVQHR
jgi:glyceraldehyde-3-phosphate dehydrogenase (NAD(P))